MTQTDRSIYHGERGSVLANKYSQCRPVYPEELYHSILSMTPGRAIAVDCGTGNGQAAQSLARYFTRVVAIDSAEQIAKASPCSNIEYRAGEAETIPLPDSSADLVTAAQAVHWFNLDRYFSEVKRVLRPGGVLAVWCYLIPSVEEGIDHAFWKLYRDSRLHRFWPPWIEHVEAGYTTLPCLHGRSWQPFSFTATAKLDLRRFLDVIDTWAVTQLARKAHDTDAEEAVQECMSEISAAWKPSEIKKTVTWKVSGATVTPN